MKKIFEIFIILLLASCQSFASKEFEKSVKANSASGRINSSDNNSQDLFKELD